MDILKKLEILSDAAKYDVSCVSSGSNRKSKAGHIGNTSGSAFGICHSWSEDGRCISLLKILLTNVCIYNCAYCVNRSTNDVPRASFTPREVADITINFYRRNYIEGLFLSSAIVKSPDHTMELLLCTVSILRTEYRFNGYIHIKAIPGSDPMLIFNAGQLVDRMSVNIELPSSEGLKLLAPQKKREAILKPMEYIHNQIAGFKNESGLFRYTPSFVPAGQSTQLIVGATPDHDLKIITLSEGLYKRYKLRRVFYSAYVPVTSSPVLPAITKPPLLREHRLYQADWLLRFYGFDAKELLDDKHPYFSMDMDPKCDWALRNLHLFPLEINKADYGMLLKVPGIGVQSAKRIIAARRLGLLEFDNLRKMGIVLKRARHFITCSGKYYGQASMNEMLIRESLIDTQQAVRTGNTDYEQLPLPLLGTADLVPIPAATIFSL